jgi:superkiller protein 3
MKITAAICSYRLSLFTSEDDGIASARFDFGLALHKYALQTPDVEVRAKKVTAAIEMVRLALVSEPGNPSYWAAFGTFNFLDHPKVSQHAYITALEINNKVNCTTMKSHNELNGVVGCQTVDEPWLLIPS